MGIFFSAVALVMAIVASPGSATGRSHTIAVTTTIQAAVDAARPGDIVLVPAGDYRESVRVSTAGVTIMGGPDAVLDGEGLAAPVGIRVQSTDGTRLDGFTLRGMEIRDFSHAGVILDSVDDFRLTGTSYVDNDDYGLFPIRSSGRVDHNTVVGSSDTGLYVGQSSNVRMDSNVARGNLIGIEVELSTSIQVTDNLAVGNMVGIAVQIVPGLALTSTSDIQVTGNRLIANNRPNDVTDPTELLSMVPSGIGLLDVAADQVTIKANVITDNPTAGIGVVSLPAPAALLDPRLDPAPDGTLVSANTFQHNGYAADPKIFGFGLAPADIVWDGTGTGNCFDHNPSASSFPAELPSC
jgi:parallel beta-helix repeat protein